MLKTVKWLNNDLNIGLFVKRACQTVTESKRRCGKQSGETLDTYKFVIIASLAVELDISFSYVVDLANPIHKRVFI